MPDITHSYNGNQQQGIDWPTRSNIGTVEPAATSSLFQQLCSRDDITGSCRFPSEVTIDANLVCDGTECLLDTVRAIKVVDGGETVYYQYVEVECSHQVFYEGAKQIKSGKEGTGDEPGRAVMCANPRAAVAGAACCANAGTTTHPAQARCQYAREYVTFDTAMGRCGIRTSQYANQYIMINASNVTGRMVSLLKNNDPARHFDNINWVNGNGCSTPSGCGNGNAFWKIYEKGVGPSFCDHGCGSEDTCPIESCPPGDPEAVSECRSPQEAFEVRCCSHTPVAAQPGDSDNQAYGLTACGYGYPGMQMAAAHPDGRVSDGGRIPDAPWGNVDVYSNGFITDFANRTCAEGATTCTDVASTTDTAGNGCAWYTGNSSQCGNFNRDDEGGTFLAGDLCCACGGGLDPPEYAADECEGCLHAKTYEEAEAACATDGARLCTQWEMESQCDNGAACNSDSRYVWTSTQCDPEPMHMCERFPIIDGPSECAYDNEWVWMDRDCELQLQVAHDGSVLVVHGGERTVDPARHNSDKTHTTFVEDNGNAFGVTWSDTDDDILSSNYPLSEDSCANSGCTPSGLTCLCTPTISTVAEFTDTSNVTSSSAGATGATVHWCSNRGHVRARYIPSTRKLHRWGG